MNSDRLRDIKNGWREEALELLDSLDASLLELEEHPGNAEEIDRAFRCLHTIKGSGAMFGFGNITEFVHELETAFETVREGGTPVTKRLVDLALSGGDLVRKMLDGEEPDNQWLSEIRSLAEADPQTPSRNGSETFPADDPDTANHCYLIRFLPKSGMFSNATDPIPLLNELKTFGDCAVAARTAPVPELGQIDPEACYTSWDIVLSTSKGINDVRDVFIFVEGDCALEIEQLDDAAVPENGWDCGTLLELLGESGRLKRKAENLPYRKSAPDESLKTFEKPATGRTKFRKSGTSSNIRVPTGRLDELVNLVGEMVTLQLRLDRKAQQYGDDELISVAEEVGRVTEQLRDNAMNMRMVPFGTIFGKYKRLVRDLANELGKEIAFLATGGETELDKTVIDRLHDPLVHIIRNSAGHGIEMPEHRERLGKSREGVIALSAEHRDASVVIRISDDGSGLDYAAIREKALERGLIDPGADMTGEELGSLIFIPGFSTVEKISGVSGRGVGMDVVKRRVETLQGVLNIDGEKGFGTAITIRLPLTLAIIDGLLVKVGGDHYVFPLLMVDECVKMSRADADTAAGRDMMDLGGKAAPYLCLRDIFGATGEPPAEQQVVITRTEGRKTGFAVDTVVGRHQTVVKPMNRYCKGDKGVSGATILGDGTVALILDIEKLVNS